MSAPGRMISYERWGYRMIGSTRPGVRRIGQQFATGPTNAPPASSYGGELSTAAPVPRPVRVVALHTGGQAPTVVRAEAPPAPPPPPTAPVDLTIAQDQCPPCDCTRSRIAAGAVGVAAGGLLMWLVGLATKEKKRRAA